MVKLMKVTGPTETSHASVAACRNFVAGSGTASDVAEFDAALAAGEAYTYYPVPSDREFGFTFTRV